MHLLPDQLVMEVHVQSLKHWLLRKEIGHYVELFRVLFEAGYTVFENKLGDGGCEVSFIRISGNIDYHADQLPAVNKNSSLPISTVGVRDVAASGISVPSTSSDGPTHHSRRGGHKAVEGAFRVLSKEANAIDTASLAKLITDYGIRKPDDLTLLDKEHVEALADQLKVVPKKKFLLALSSSASTRPAATASTAATAATRL